jgi:hypothetical protein
MDQQQQQMQRGSTPMTAEQLRALQNTLSPQQYAWLLKNLQQQQAQAQQGQVQANMYQRQLMLQQQAQAQQAQAQQLHQLQQRISQLSPEMQIQVQQQLRLQQQAQHAQQALQRQLGGHAVRPSPQQLMQMQQQQATQRHQQLQRQQQLQQMQLQQLNFQSRQQAPPQRPLPPPSYPPPLRSGMGPVKRQRTYPKLPLPPLLPPMNTYAERLKKGDTGLLEPGLAHASLSKRRGALARKSFREDSSSSESEPSSASASEGEEGEEEEEEEQDEQEGSSTPLNVKKVTEDAQQQVDKKEKRADKPKERRAIRQTKHDYSRLYVVLCLCMYDTQLTPCMTIGTWRDSRN